MMPIKISNSSNTQPVLGCRLGQTANFIGPLRPAVINPGGIRLVRLGARVWHFILKHVRMPVKLGETGTHATRSKFEVLSPGMHLSTVQSIYVGPTPVGLSSRLP